MTETLSEKIAAIKAGLKGVTPGEWSHEPTSFNKLDRILYAGRGETRHGLNLMTLGDGDWNFVNNVNHIARLDPGTVGEIIARLERLEADNARLRAALKPFAKEAAQWGSGFTDDGRIYVLPTGSGNNRAKFNVGDLRKARAALEGK